MLKYLHSCKITTIFIVSIKTKSSMKVWKVKEMIKFLEADGWYLHSQRGSHRQFKHPAKKGRVTVPGKLSDDLAPKTANSILRQAGLI